MNKKSKLLALLGAAVCSFSAQAALWNFSYSFAYQRDGGDSMVAVSGSFTGDEDGPYIRNLGNVVMYEEIRGFNNDLIFKTPLPPLYALGNEELIYEIPNWEIPPPVPPAVASKDLGLNNFFFSTLPDSYGGGFTIRTDMRFERDVELQWGRGAYDIPGAQERWILTRAEVPEPGSMVLLAMGLAVMGLRSLRRREYSGRAST